jgi:hypothetical protein
MVLDMLPIVLPFGHVATADTLVDRGRVGFVRQCGTHHGLFMEFVLVLDGLEDAHNVGFQYHAAHDLLGQRRRGMETSEQAKNGGELATCCAEKQISRVAKTETVNLLQYRTRTISSSILFNCG